MCSTESLERHVFDVEMKTPRSQISNPKKLANPQENHQNVHASQPKSHSKPSLSVEVQEEIDRLYEYIPEVERLFNVIGKAGEGTFSAVFLAKLREYPGVREMFALKHINPTSHPDRIEQELRCLLEIGGQANVMGVKLCLRHKDHVAIVMPYVDHNKFAEYVQVLSVCEVRDYMRNLLIALQRVHKFNIIHRDIKPSNFLYNRENKHFSLVDFGLAQKVPTKITKTSSLPNTNGKSLSTMDPVARSKAVGDAGKRPPLKTLCEDNKRNTSTPNQATSKSKSFHSKRTVDRPAISTTSKQLKSPRRFVMAKRMNMDRGLSKPSSRSSLGRSENIPNMTCKCFGQPTVCRICKSRGNQQAPRAGTPGFRSPEVLLKYPAQTTAVDIWSAGVIFLSLLSGRYPFFRANDDMTAMSQIVSLLGSEEVKAAAKTYGKTVSLNTHCEALNLKGTCCKLRSRNSTTDKLKCRESWHCAPDSAFDLLGKLLDLNPHTRITAQCALEHPFFNRTSCPMDEHMDTADDSMIM